MKAVAAHATRPDAFSGLARTVRALGAVAVAALASLPGWALDGVPTASLERIDLLPAPGHRAQGLGLIISAPHETPRHTLGLNPNSLPRLDVGVQWRYTLDGNFRFNIAAWRQGASTEMPGLNPNREPVYGARVEMQIFDKRRTGFVADYGFIGLQFESGTRLMLRRKDGVPTLYLRTSF